MKVSNIARVKWVQQPTVFETGILEAWERAREIRRTGDIAADELRYHEKTETVLVVKSGFITAVLPKNTVGETVKRAISG